MKKTPAKKRGQGSPKKRGGGVSRSDGGEGSFQKSLLNSLKDRYSLTDAETAQLLGTNYNTYKTWKNGTRKMTGTTLRLIAIMMALDKKRIMKIAFP